MVSGKNTIYFKLISFRYSKATLCVIFPLIHCHHCLFFFSDEEALKLIAIDSLRSQKKKRGSNWQERDMGSILLKGRMD